MHIYAMHTSSASQKNQCTGDYIGNQWTTDCFKEVKAKEVGQAYLGEFEIKDFRLKYLHSTDSTRLVTYLRDSSK